MYIICNKKNKFLISQYNINMKQFYFLSLFDLMLV
uniref:Uncharacterized protein n=1 Tax=Vertebrata thuyoides TaxID=2006970 RepID=A0A1Z1MB44_9FLOR|nr:hypothetical protein [Vertebrata thuyoides]ARW63190.1 hypothetical protein [Vertebrata thuyoides]